MKLNKAQNSSFNSWTRRDFLHLTSMTAASLSMPSWAFGESFVSGTLPILQGATDATSASFVVLHSTAAPLGVEVRGPGGAVIAHKITDVWSLPESDDATTAISVEGLRSGTDYQLRIIDERGKLLDRRIFRSLDTGKRGCRFGVMSCMHDSYTDQAESMWESLAAENCDFVVFLGDTCYADSDHSGEYEADYARRYAETRRVISWFRMKRLVPSFATWDDHDFGLDNADRTFKHAKFTRQLFRKFWGAQPNSLWQPAFGVGSVLEAFGQRFFLLDDRSFRDPEGSRNGRHLGNNQTEWLLTELSRSKTPSWLMNGSQFFGAYLGKESFEADHAGDFKDFTKKLARVPAPVAFVSGDVHFSELMEIEPDILGYKTYEFTSSSMHSMTFPLHQHRAFNPRRVTSDWRHNYHVFNVDLSRGWQINAACVLEGSERSYSEDLSISRS